MDAAQWTQDVGLVRTMEDVGSMPSSRPLTERRVGPQKDQALNCPRCNSTNTKFCYYNNYSLTQPRYFCKTCRRYWTEGGSLRNVPVGGGSRKNKRASVSSSLPSASSKKSPHDLTPRNPKLCEGQDLNLAFQISNIQDYQSLPQFVHSNSTISSSTLSSSSSLSSSSTSLSALELLSGMPSRGVNSFMSLPMMSPSSVAYPPGLGLRDLKPAFNFPLDGFGGGYGGTQAGIQGGSRRFVPPFEDLKPSPATEIEQNKGRGDVPGGYWNGMLGGGSW